MGDVYWGVHLPIASLAAKAGIKVAVETGTFYGSGALHLAAMFEKVLTIEVNPSLAEMCQSLYSSISNIQFIHAPAPIGLNQVLGQFDEPVFFFLDAHWFPAPSISEDANLSGNVQCQIISEIQIISKYRNAGDGSIIVIDDSDMFLGSLPPIFNDHAFPSIAKIIERLYNEFQAEYVEVIDDVIYASSQKNANLIDLYRQYRTKYGCPSFKKLR